MNRNIIQVIFVKDIAGSKIHDVVVQTNDGFETVQVMAPCVYSAKTKVEKMSNFIYGSLQKTNKKTYQ